MERTFQTVEGPGREEGRAPLQARWSGHASGSVRVAYRAAAPAVIQLCGGEDWQTILNLCHAHGYEEIDEDTAKTLGERLRMQRESYPNRLPAVPIPSHNAELRYYSGARSNYRIHKTKPSGYGPMGRLAREGGDRAYLEEYRYGRRDGLFYDPPPPPPPPPGFEHKATLDRAGLARIRPRRSLNRVMGGSAVKRSGVLNSEYLHLVAHSNGGVDEASNLAVGPRALNTAMIPFEKFVHELLRNGIEVKFSIREYPRPGFGMEWINKLGITISFYYNETKHKKMWMLGMLSNQNGQLSRESYDEIEASVQKFRESCGL